MLRRWLTSFGHDHLPPTKHPGVGRTLTDHGGHLQESALADKESF